MVTSNGCNKPISTDMRLSHAESTDSGMGFSDNAKEADNSRLSAGDGYGTIHLVNPIPLEEHENRKSLLDGDAEYDEVMDFISSPTEQEQILSDNVPKLSTFKTPPKKDEREITSPGDSASKYSELDLAVRLRDSIELNLVVQGLLSGYYEENLSNIVYLSLNSIK